MMPIRHVLTGLLGCAALWSAGRVRADSPKEFNPTVIDQMIRTEWKSAGISPAPPVDDARFLRRVYLDITGTLPTPEVITEFLASKSQYKRYEVVNQLLDSPQYVEHWVNYWDSILMGGAIRRQVVDKEAFRGWLHDEFTRNTPYNKFVYDLLTASGQNSKDGSYGKLAAMVQKQQANGVNAQQAKKGRKARNAAIAAAAANAASTPVMKADDGTTAAKTEADGTMMMKEDTTARVPDQPVNGAVNWYLKYQGMPADLSGNASRIFLGVQIQCAQCHDHKTEKWKQTDFQKFTACFTRTKPTRLDAGQKGGFQRIVLSDVDGTRGMRRLQAVNKKGKANPAAEYAAAVPAALDGTDFSGETNRREALAKWMTADSNPWFAQEIVNRTWAYFMGRGFVDPVDDFRTTNPVIMPDLLKKLSDDFIANKYDMKYLIRTICATQAYQLACSPARNNDTRNTLWASHRLKEMEPAALTDALIQVTGMEPVLEKVSRGNVEAVKAGLQKQITFLFDVDEEFEQKDFEGTIPQALMLLNGNLVNSGTTPIPGTTLAEVMAMPGDDDAKIQSLYLRTLSRKPSTSELSYWREFVNAKREVVKTEGPPPQMPLRNGPLAAKLQNGLKGKRNNGVDPLARFRGRLQSTNATPRQQAYEDLFWTLLNSSEFIFNH